MFFKYVVSLLNAVIFYVVGYYNIKKTVIYNNFCFVNNEGT